MAEIDVGEVIATALEGDESPEMTLAVLCAEQRRASRHLPPHFEEHCRRMAAELVERLGGEYGSTPGPTSSSSWVDAWTYVVELMIGLQELVLEDQEAGREESCPP